MMPADHALQSKQNNLKNEKKIMEKVCVTSAVKKKKKREKKIPQSQIFQGNFQGIDYVITTKNRDIIPSTHNRKKEIT